MVSQSIKNITVIGAGTMGNGIAHVFAQYGFAVTLCDVKPEFLDRAMKTVADAAGERMQPCAGAHPEGGARSGRVRTRPSPLRLFPPHSSEAGRFRGAAGRRHRFGPGKRAAGRPAP